MPEKMNAGAGRAGLKRGLARLPLGMGRTDSPLFGYILTAPSIILMLILLFLPMAYSFYLSFIDTDLTNQMGKFIGLTGYLRIFQEPYTWVVLQNSFVWTLAVTFFQFVAGLGAALLLNQMIHGKWFFRSITVLPWIIPGIVAAMIWRLFYDAQLGFLNNALLKTGLWKGYIDWLGTPGLAMFAVILVAIWKGFGFSMLMYLAALQTVPNEQYESSIIDGANPIQQFFYVTFPNISSVIRITLLLTSVWTFNYFDIIYAMTGGGPIRSTHIAPTFIYELAFRNFNFGEASRFAVFSFVIVSAVSIVYINRIWKKEGF